MSDDLLGVAHLLPCDPSVQFWWQLVLIWSQIRRICVLGDFRAHCSTTRRQSGVYQGTVCLSGSSPGKFFSMYCFASAQARTVRHSDTDSTPLLRNLGQNCFTLSVFGVLAGGQSGADRGQSGPSPADNPALCCLLGFAAFRRGLGLVVSRGSRYVSWSSS